MDPPRVRDRRGAALGVAAGGDGGSDSASSSVAGSGSDSGSGSGSGSGFRSGGAAGGAGARRFRANSDVSMSRSSSSKSGGGGPERSVSGGGENPRGLSGCGWCHGWVAGRGAGTAALLVAGTWPGAERPPDDGKAIVRRGPALVLTPGKCQLCFTCGQLESGATAAHCD